MLTRAYAWMLREYLATSDCDRAMTPRACCVCEDAEVAVSGQETYRHPCWSDADLARYSVCGDECVRVFSNGYAVARHIGAYIGREVPERVLVNQLVKDDVALEAGSKNTTQLPLLSYGCDGMVCFNGPYLPHWILHPVHCGVGVMKQIERWCFSGWIPRGLFTLWIEAAFPLYITDTSLNSQVFWDTACTNIMNLAGETKHKIVNMKLPAVETVDYQRCERWTGCSPRG